MQLKKKSIKKIIIKRIRIKSNIKKSEDKIKKNYNSINFLR